MTVDSNPRSTVSDTSINAHMPDDALFGKLPRRHSRDTGHTRWRSSGQAEDGGTAYSRLVRPADKVLMFASTQPIDPNSATCPVSALATILFRVLLDQGQLVSLSTSGQIMFEVCVCHVYVLSAYVPILSGCM
jgi:hypothetical protein